MAIITKYNNILFYILLFFGLSVHSFAEQNINNGKYNKESDEKKQKITNKKKLDNDQNGSNYLENLTVKKDLFIYFDEKKALNFDYNNVKFDNFEFLENKDELAIIKRSLLGKQNHEIGKFNRDKESARQNSIGSESGNINNFSEHLLKIYSLIFFNKNKWEAKINYDIVNNINKKTFFGVKIFEVNKDSIVFIIEKPDNKIIEKVNKIIDDDSSYSDNYNIINKGKKTYITFMLYVGQKIDLDTMEITT